MKKNHKFFVSVIIANYNNAKYIAQCIESILNQSYKFIEIIVVDDGSSDNSLIELNKFKKKIKLIKNSSNKNIHGSQNQINSYYRGYLKSKGDLIFFLDSDDFFHKNKIKELSNFFLKKNNINIVFDLPILKYKNKTVKKFFKQKFFLLSSWPRFTPQSCISGRRKYINEIFKQCRVKKFNSIWFDFRIAVYTFLKFKEIFIFEKYLTFYRQLDSSASKNWKTFSKNWWLRREEAHGFYSFMCMKLNKKDKLTLDKLFTKLICLIIK